MKIVFSLLLLGIDSVNLGGVLEEKLLDLSGLVQTGIICDLFGFQDCQDA
jgi:hypothetical protein